MDSLGATGPCGLNYGILIQVGLLKAFPLQVDGVVCNLDVERGGVGIRLYSDTGQARLSCGLEDPDSYLAPIGHQDLGEGPGRTVHPIRCHD